MRIRIVSALLLLAAAGLLPAASVSLTGALLFRDDVAFANFSLSTDSTVTLRTFSYAGGTDAAGDSISAGGFDPALSLFQADGLQFLLALDDASHCGGPLLGADPVTGLCLDAELADLSLPAGQYLVALTQSDQLPVGPTLSDGFTPATPFGPEEFVDFTGAVRNGNWELDIIGADNVTVAPEAGTVWLAILGVVTYLASVHRPPKSHSLIG